MRPACSTAIRQAKEKKRRNTASSPLRRAIFLRIHDRSGADSDRRSEISLSAQNAPGFQGLERVWKKREKEKKKEREGRTGMRSILEVRVKICLIARREQDDCEDNPN